MKPTIEQMKKALRACAVSIPEETPPCEECYLHPLSNEGYMSTGRTCFEHPAMDVIAALDEWAKAHEEGRLVVLPCKVGDTVYYLTGKLTIGEGSLNRFDRIEESTAKGFFYDEDGLEVQLNHDWKGNHGDYGTFGKTIFLTREEAEAALQQREEDR